MICCPCTTTAHRVACWVQPPHCSRSCSRSGWPDALADGAQTPEAAWGVALALHIGAFVTGSATQTYTVADFRIAFLAAAALAIVSALAFTRLDPHAGADASGHRAAPGAPKLATSAASQTP